VQDAEVLMAKTILIIDDDPDWVRMLSMRLQHEGYQIEVAFDAVQALSQTVKSKPDLVLLDIMMPAGSGLVMLEYLRENVKTFNIPVIVLTGISDKQTKEAAEKLGISGYFVKPVDMDKLIEELKEVLIKQ
jgi:DNA-binding response OmpR family regulator